VTGDPATPSHRLLNSRVVGVEKTCRKHGYHMVMASTDNDYEAERDQIRRMSEAGCAAVVLTPTPRTRKQLQTDYLRSEFLDLPIVLLDAAYPEQKRSQVVFDNYSAGYEMTKLLLREGHKRIAFIELNTAEGDLLYRSVADRRRGYMDAIGEAGLPLVKEDIWTLCVDPVGSDADIPRSVLKRLPEEMYPEVIPLMDRWARLEDRPTAVIALEDTVASQLVNIAMEMGITIPDQLQIVGFDNTIAGRTCRPSFPTTDPDFARAGQMAAEIAFQHLRGSTREQTIYVLPAPIRRRKTALHQTKSVASRHMVASGA
jgi:DNA-binding LacI/PurR family transcriptional regulator